MNAADYPGIQRALKEIPCDKFIVNYTPYPHPHNLAREFFLSHKEYTHLIIQPQDLLVTKEDYLSLIESVKDYDVLSCVCNVEREGHPDHHKWNICKKIPSKDRLKRYYNWFPETDKKLGIVQVEFQGMAFTIISRNIIERHTLDGEWIFKGAIHSGIGQYLAAPDLTFCHCCLDLNIPIYTNTDIRLIHYSNHKPNLVGKREASTTFIKYNGTE